MIEGLFVLLTSDYDSPLHFVLCILESIVGRVVLTFKFFKTNVLKGIASLLQEIYARSVV